MRNVVVCCFVIITLFSIACSTSPQDLEATWQEFKEKFNRFYDNPAEETRRKYIFRKHLESAREHNKKVDKGLLTTYRPEFNFFSDMTGDERARYSGTIAPPRNSRIFC